MLTKEYAVIHRLRGLHRFLASIYSIVLNRNLRNLWIIVVSEFNFLGVTAATLRLSGERLLIIT